MSTPTNDAAFSGAIPQIYETLLVPMLFAPYAVDLAQRVAAAAPSRVLEIAAGTGVVTRALAEALPSSTSITATDLNQAMLNEAAALGTKRPVEWKQADAMQLPFADNAFDMVVCQFGVMFFPDKSKAYAEIRRVLKPGGLFLFNVWDRVDANDFAAIISRALESFFPDDPPRFLTRTPYAYYDFAAIAHDLADGGFTASADFATVPARSVAPSPQTPAIAFCHGTPLRAEIEAHGAAKLGDATNAASEALLHRFGPGTINASMQAHVVVVKK